MIFIVLQSKWCPELVDEAASVKSMGSFEGADQIRDIFGLCKCVVPFNTFYVDSQPVACRSNQSSCRNPEQTNSIVKLWYSMPGATPKFQPFI